MTAVRISHLGVKATIDIMKDDDIHEAIVGKVVEKAITHEVIVM